MSVSIYWLAYRLEDNKRYGFLLDAIDRVSGSWWMEPPGFYLFESGADIDHIAGRVKKVIDPAKDVVVLGALASTTARVIGNVTEQSLFYLMPFAQRV
jgi:hypothetical protein